MSESVKYIVWVNGKPHLVNEPTLEATSKAVAAQRRFPLDETDKINCVMGLPVLSVGETLKEEFQERVVKAAAERRAAAREKRA